MVNKHNLFLKWVAINTLVGILLGITGKLYLHDLISLGGISKLVFVIIAIFVFSSAYAGYLCWRTDKEKLFPDSRRRKNILYDTEHIWFVISALQLFGLVGGIIGMLSGLLKARSLSSMPSADQTQSIFHAILNGAAGGITVTLFGVGASLVLALLHHLLVNELERNE